MAPKSKKIKAIVKLQLKAGVATPAPPVGPALGQHGINIMGFCKEYNERTASMSGQVIPAEITIYADNSFTFVTKTPPAAEMIKMAMGVKGASTPGKEPYKYIPMAKAREIAQTKMPDLNAVDLDGATKVILGTARSMGIKVEE
ncbi:MAG: 50S ribosomal protein L11 [Chloroflexi bacterium]|nr:50S ribosomal protein L11 [Chloroflexota bacterium]